MSNVVSQTEIQKFKDNEKVVFKTGTIITPSARDWANEHNIKISFEGLESQDREDCLRKTVSSVVKEFKQKGMTPDMGMVVQAVNSCLARLGCKVEK